MSTNPNPVAIQAPFVMSLDERLGRADYRRGKLDGIFGNPREKNSTFMYYGGYDAGAKSVAEEEVNDPEPEDVS